MPVLPDRAHLASNPQMRFLVYAVISLFLTVFTIVFLNFLAVGGVAPDLLLILCVWVALAEGQFSGLLFAFVVGMIFDIASNDVLGSNALAKILAAFVAGYFYQEEKVNQILGGLPFLGVVTVSGLVHNLVYYFLYIRPSEIAFGSFFISYGLAATLYTTVIALVPMFWKSRSMLR
ncbi:MAG: rod shape-determining protein MreD [Candidatus Kapaibacterium sp.]|jgi:rod shape-determining protein MreD